MTFCSIFINDGVVTPHLVSEREMRETKQVFALHRDPVDSELLQLVLHGPKNKLYKRSDVQDN